MASNTGSTSSQSESASVIWPCWVRMSAILPMVIARERVSPICS